MVDIAHSISSAIAIAKKLKDLGNKIKDAEFKNLLADLNLELAEIKMRLAEVLEENRTLKLRVQDLEHTDGEQCPKCRKRTWQLVSSRPDLTFGEVGGIRRTYKCSACGFSESPLHTPNG